jgi:GGDEF domain-containing protein
MTNKDTPKAWLPAESFTHEARQRYIACFADLVNTQVASTVQFYRWTGEDYVTAASA